MSFLPNWLRKLGHIISNLFSTVVSKETEIIGVFTSMRDDVTAFVANLKDFQQFTYDPAWASRVINVPRAIDGIQQLFDIILHSLREKFDALKVTVEAIIAELENKQGFHDEGPSAVGDVASKFATLEILLLNFQTTLHQALDIEQTLLDVKHRVETLDDLFLPQGSTKKTVDVRYRKRNA